MATDWLINKLKELHTAEEKENAKPTPTEARISWNSQSDCEEFQGEIRQAAQHRNADDISGALTVYLWGEVDEKIRKVCRDKAIVAEGRSLHFLSHSAGTWFRLPRSLNVIPNSFGKAFFRENIYAKFYDNYFREIPKELLVTLGDFFVHPPASPAPVAAVAPGKAPAPVPLQIEAFSSPTLVVIGDKRTLSTSKGSIETLKNLKMATFDREVPLQVVVLKEQTVSSVGKDVFTKDKDSFQILIQSCHRYLSDSSSFFDDVKADKDPMYKALHGAMQSFDEEEMFQNLRVTEENDKLKITLAFLLSFYSVLTTDFACVYRADRTYKSRLLGLYVDPIKASFTNQKKRGAFFVGFSCKKKDFPTHVIGAIPALHEIFSEETKRLYGLDSQVALETADGQSRILLEEMLVRCSLISDKHKEDPNVNKARCVILNGLLPSDAPLDFRTEGGEIIKITDVDPVKTVTGTSERYCSLLERLIETAKSNLLIDAKPPMFKGGQCIFLYSPPGCGKETIAKLIHLVARTFVRVADTGTEKIAICPRYWEALTSNWRRSNPPKPLKIGHVIDYPINPDSPKTLGCALSSPPSPNEPTLQSVPPGISLKERKAFEEVLEKAHKEAVEKWEQDKNSWRPVIKAPLLLETARENGLDFEINNLTDILGELELSDWKWKQAEWWKLLFEFSYFSVNCALLTEGSLERILFGFRDEDGLSGLRQIGFLAGTAFLDEVNTLPKGIENRLLRLLESPYEALFHKREDSVAPRQRISGLNVLFVFASNKTPEELIDLGYNSAFIGRIRQYYFEIPPLKERPEDIALAFSTMLHKKYEEDHTLAWERVSLEAFRFVCMLPWTDNFRGLQGFVEALAVERRMRRISTKEISFEEIIECAVKHDLLTGRAGKEGKMHA